MTGEEWNAIQNRDERYNGKFYYGLTTTKKLCRPSCYKKSCNPKNVVIFYALEAGLKAGYRPCLRCCPERENWMGERKELGKKAADWLEANYTEHFSLDLIASELHVDKNYLQRAFKDAMGSTLLQYHNLLRCRHANELLERCNYSITYIAGAVGFNTASHFSRVYKKLMGCTPSEYKETRLRAARKARAGS